MRNSKRGEAEHVLLIVFVCIVMFSLGMWSEDKRIMQMAIDSHPHKPCVICNPPSVEKPVMP